MINNLNRSELVARGLGGGAVIIASGSEPVTEGSVTILKWWRLYSDMWLEQGGLGYADNTSATYLNAPFSNKYYSINVTAVSGTSYGIRIDNDTVTTSSFKVLAVSGTSLVYYTARGYVTSDTFSHLRNGDLYDPLTNKWSKELLLKFSTGSQNYTLATGTYRVYLVGKGGDAVYWGGGNRRQAHSGSAGGTLIVDFSVEQETAATFSINTSTSNTEMRLDNVVKLAAGFGKPGKSGEVVDDGSATIPGGSNTISSGFSCTEVLNTAGENSRNSGAPFQYDYDWGDLYTEVAHSALYTKYSITNGNSGRAKSSHGGGGEILKTPDPGLVMLYKLS